MNWWELIQKVGIPLGMLIILARYHVKVVLEKDKEIKDLNREIQKQVSEEKDKRIEASHRYSASLVDVVTVTNEVARESTLVISTMYGDKNE